MKGVKTKVWDRVKYQTWFRVRDQTSVDLRDRLFDLVWEQVSDVVDVRIWVPVKESSLRREW